MRFPFPVTPPLSVETQSRWIDHFESFRIHDRTVEEGIWRRTQGPANAEESRWVSEKDARRRIVHYHYRFCLSQTNRTTCLAIRSLYLYQSLTLPLAELNEFQARVSGALKEGGWGNMHQATWTRDDLHCNLRRFVVHPEDALARRHLPRGYQSLDVTLTAGGSLSAGHRRLPWEVMSRGIRQRDTRGAPTIAPSLAPLAQFLPFQVELGCGISTEAGIPPLHTLHDLYTVTDRSTGTFVFGGAEDKVLPDLLSSPETHVHLTSQMKRACLIADPTQAHQVLKELAARQILLTPIITNNFDGLPSRVGLDECYIRRYDEEVPDVPIHPETRALLVIGSHADRRKVQARFRERGLPIFFLDPEGFYENEKFLPYPIEGALDGDFICQTGATAGLLELAKELGLDVNR